MLVMLPECCKRRRLCFCTTCGAISLILTVSFAVALGLSLTDELFFLIIKKQLELVPGSEAFDDWRDTNDEPIYQTFYVFDTENPDQYISGAVPVVREIGPFVYRKYDTKLNLTWNSDESVVTYNRDVYYVFVSERSIGDPQDYTVTILNIPLLGILNQQGRVENLLFRILGVVLANFYLTLIGDQNLFIEKTAHETIWGYSDPLIQVLVALGLSDDPLMRIQVNTSNPEIFYSVNTGKKDIDSVGNYIQWNNLSIIPGWNSEDARRVDGSDGQQYPPRLKKQRLKVFVEQVTRHIWMAFEDKTKIHGIELYCYRNVHTVLSNVSEYPPNIGYNAYHFLYGLINETTNTPLDLPVFISKPHCLDCDPEYFKNVSGYHPDRKRHDGFSDIEPFTGLMMNGALRGQANVRIERNVLSRQLSLVQDVTLYPWFYFSLEGTISEDDADEFKRDIQLPRLILKIFVIICLCISGTITLCVVGLLLRSYCNKRCKITKGYKSINEDVKNQDSVDGSSDSVKIDHCNVGLLSDKNSHKYYQTIT